MKKQLDYQPDADQALAYLREKHSKYLPELVVGEEAARSEAGSARAAEGDGQPAEPAPEPN